MKNKSVLVTSYINPDLDGLACAYAYAELLTKRGKKAKAGIFGTPHREAQFVLDYLKMKQLPDAQPQLSKSGAIVLVDTSYLGTISKKVDPNEIIEVIDHHRGYDAGQFPKARIQIELVGAAATLIAEKFFKAKIKPSKKAATLLYTAIISNTINFQANVTTDRDREAAQKLGLVARLPENFIHEMFAHKSRLEQPLRDLFIEDLFISKFGGKKVSIMQLEIVGVEEFIKKNLEDIQKTLLEFRKEHGLDLIFLTCVDLERAFNILVAADEFAETVLKQALEIEFSNLVARRKGVLMRKEIVPLIKKILEN